MIIKAENLPATLLEAPRGGTGTATRMAYDAACGFKGEVTNFAMMSLNPASSIGLHKHTGDMEIYMILDGTPKTSDNGVEAILGPCDMLVTKDGEEHCLINDTDTPVVFLALIIKH